MLKGNCTTKGSSVLFPEIDITIVFGVFFCFFLSQSIIRWQSCVPALNVHVCCSLPHNNWMTAVGAFSFDEISFYRSQTRFVC